MFYLIVLNLSPRLLHYIARLIEHLNVAIYVLRVRWWCLVGVDILLVLSVELRDERLD